MVDQGLGHTYTRHGGVRGGGHGAWELVTTGESRSYTRRVDTRVHGHQTWDCTDTVEGARDCRGGREGAHDRRDIKP